MRKFGILACTAMILVGFAAQLLADDLAGKKLLFIDSYNEGYAWSDGIERGVRSALEGTGVELKVVRMDTYRIPGEEHAKKAAEEIKGVIEEWKPDIVVAADDNASKYIIVPFFKGGDLPFVFNGVNWRCDQYGFPASNVTGMIEVAPARELIGHLKPFAKGGKIGYIAMDNPNNRRELGFFGEFLDLEFDGVKWPTSAEEFKAQFLELQEEVDIIFIDSDGGAWSDEEKKDIQAFMAANTKVPTGTCIDFMAEYVMLGFSKMPEEQGEWSTKAALRILGGTPVSDIPVVPNTKGSLTINVPVVNNLGVELPYELVELATRVIE